MLQSSRLGRRLAHISASQGGVAVFQQDVRHHPRPHLPPLAFLRAIDRTMRAPCMSTEGLGRLLPGFEGLAHIHHSTPSNTEFQHMQVPGEGTLLPSVYVWSFGIEGTRGNRWLEHCISVASVHSESSDTHPLCAPTAAYSPLMCTSL